MGSIFIKTLIMFLLAFAIAMLVALLIYWIRSLLTSVRVNSIFDETSKRKIRRAKSIHKIHEKTISVISGKVEQEIHPELFDYYMGINDEFEQPEDYHGTLKPMIRRRHKAKKNKNPLK